MKINSKSKHFGTVYIIHCLDTNIYKIGCTRPYSNGCWHVRYKTGFGKFCPHPMSLVLELQVPEYSKLEAKLHAMFKEFRMNGEFFKLSRQQLQEAINIIKIQHKNTH